MPSVLTNPGNKNGINEYVVMESDVDSIQSDSGTISSSSKNFSKWTSKNAQVTLNKNGDSFTFIGKNNNRNYSRSTLQLPASGSVYPIVIGYDGKADGSSSYILKDIIFRNSAGGKCE